MSTTYTPIGVIREELRREIRSRAATLQGHARASIDLNGTTYNPLIDVKVDHYDFCGCECHFGEVEWDTAAVRHNARFGQRPPFAWAGGVG